MVSQGVIDTFGAIGGVILAICQAPQLIKLWRTKSAADLSFFYLALYSLGLFWICIYVRLYSIFDDHHVVIMSARYPATLLRKFHFSTPPHTSTHSINACSFT